MECPDKTAIIKYGLLEQTEMSWSVFEKRKEEVPTRVVAFVRNQPTRDRIGRALHK